MVAATAFEQLPCAAVWVYYPTVERFQCPNFKELIHGSDVLTEIKTLFFILCGLVPVLPIRCDRRARWWATLSYDL